MSTISDFASFLRHLSCLKQMPFNIFGFWVAFLVVFCATWLLRRHVLCRNLVLLAASYALYVAWDRTFVLLLLFLTTFGYLVALAIVQRPKHKRALLILSIVLHIAVLVLFKHFGFFVEGLRELAATMGFTLDGPMTNILVPLGLSYYVFQILGYHIDVYRGTQKPVESIINFALFVAFFPKIVAGPIERVSHLLPQFEQVRPITGGRIRENLFLLTWGLVLKFCIADNAAFISNEIFTHEKNLVAYGWFAVIAFALQIYGDFAGYSSIAKGIAGLLGFDMVWNFRQPYFATSPSDFWRRWHISLSEWFRDYVYIPLGGNRKGTARTALHLILTMTLVGLWHGTHINFLTWGLYQGLLLSLYRLGTPFVDRSRILLRITSSRIVAVGSTFVLTLIGWGMFRSILPEQRSLLLSGLLRPDFPRMPFLVIVLLWLPILAMDSFHARKNDQTAFAHAPLPLQLSFYLIAFYALLYLPPLASPDFLYVQF